MAGWLSSGAPALPAASTVRPKYVLKPFGSGLLRWKHLKEFNKGKTFSVGSSWCFLHHRNIIQRQPGFCQPLFIIPKKYARPALLCIDEVGYLSYDCHAADLLYEVINRRYEHRSVIVTTNRAFKNWNVVFPNATCIVSLLDRLTHHADITVIEGQSYRRRESEQEAAERRKQD